MRACMLGLAPTCSHASETALGVFGVKCGTDAQGVFPPPSDWGQRTQESFGLLDGKSSVGEISGGRAGWRVLSGAFFTDDAACFKALLFLDAVQ